MTTAACAAARAYRQRAARACSSSTKWRPLSVPPYPPALPPASANSRRLLLIQIHPISPLLLWD
ncbi:hypothetical protein KCP78_20180 [Salmonella enterica subsp. enterica]|nr:hypothetical protein KCP78_20180 [Salmonella enterica subsp. enterica]